MDNLTETIAPLQKLKVGDFVHHRALPSDAMRSIEHLVEAFAKADPEQKSRIVGAVESTFSFAFFLYAKSAAVESVRQKCPGLLRSGLLALAVENCTFDSRDSLLSLVRIYHSARKFRRMTADELCEEVARLSCTPFSATLSSFVRRPEEMKSLAAFGMRETTPPAPFDYEELGK